MPIVVDGVTITEVIVDGVSQSEVIVDGVQVFSAEVLLQITQGAFTHIASSTNYWGFSSITSEGFTPFGSIVDASINGQVITTLWYSDSITAGLGFLIGIAGNHVGLGETFYFSDITPEDGAIYVPGVGQPNFLFDYDAGKDETIWYWSDITAIPALWNGSGPATALMKF